MRATKLTIDHYRSIEHVELFFPEGKPLVLFGPNNAGKSNIISAINRILGERYAPYIDMEDSDFFLRDKKRHPHSRIGCHFDDVYYANTRLSTTCAYVDYYADSSKNQYSDETGNKIYLSNGQRQAIQCFLVDAERSISYQLSYASKFTLLSKFSHAIHDAINENTKDQLEEAFNTIKNAFESVPEYENFTEVFSDTVKETVQGFSHKLEVDFSAYDPNNYANTMRIVAKEGNEVRAFNEFGTGEQQILLMAFAKAYMQVFGSSSILLIFEEPEAHLHPLAQKWLKEYIYDLCDSGIQVVISTHCADFLDPSNLEGLVRVSKGSDGITRTVQLSLTDLMRQCIDSGVPENCINELGISDFFAAKLMPDDLKGLFARKVILVEGSTEYNALPIYLKKAGISLPKEGLEIVSSNGKTNIPTYARLFQAYGIATFCLFDADKGRGNDLLSIYLGEEISQFDGNDIVCFDRYAFFPKDFETTLRGQISDYQELESQAKDIFKVSGKPAIARVVAQLTTEIPAFINALVSKITDEPDEALDDSCQVLTRDCGFDESIPF